jgi:hypothetical protein
MVRGELSVTGLFGWAIAVATDQSALFFYSCGFIATLLQGVSHEVSGEKATLPQLNNVHDEYAHVTFFPALLLQSAIQTFKF